MRCEDAVQRVLEARHEGRAPSEEVLEALEREDCREQLERAERLNTLLDLDSPHEAGPGFDTRFFARLEEEKKSKRWWVPLIGTLTVASAAMITIAVVSVTKVSQTTEHRDTTELAMIRELDLLENLDVVQQLEAVETFDLLAAVDIDTLESLITEELP